MTSSSYVTNCNCMRIMKSEKRRRNLWIVRDIFVMEEKIWRR